MSKEDVVVIFLNYQSWQETLDAVEQCHEVLGVKYRNIIVIDNASPNSSAEELHKAAKDKYIFIKADTNGGYAAGNNIGLRYAYQKGYKYALILNTDIVIKDTLLVDKLLKVFEHDSAVATVNPDIYDINGYLYNRDSVKPTLWDFTFGMLQYRHKGREVKDLGGYAYIYRPQGCCMMLDVEKMHEVDYMDENTFLYVEEPILAERLSKKEYKCACCLKAQAIHNHSITVKNNLSKREIFRVKNASFAYYLRTYRNYNLLKTNMCCIFNYLKLFLARN